MASVPPSRLAVELRAALALLTRLPLGPVPCESGGAAAFGLVGALIGLVAAIPLLLLGETASLAAAGLALATAAIVSGGLHLDGLADTFDALAAPRPDLAEQARSDPRIGAAGGAAIVFVVLIDAGLLAALIGRRDAVSAASALVVAMAISRASVPILVVLARAPERGASGAWFAGRTGPWSAVLALASTALVVVAISALVGWSGPLVGTIAGGLIGLVAAGALVRLRHGIDGDLLGAAIELTFMAVLAAALLAA